MIYGIVGATLAIAVASLAAYSLVRLGPRGRFGWFLLIYSGSIFPLQMFLIPLFRLYARIGILDSFVGLLLFYTAASIPFALFALHNYFATVPRELAEAAWLDGAGHFRVYRTVYLPLSWPAIATLFLFLFTWIWNDLLFGLVLAKSPSVRPVMTAISGLMGIYSTSSFSAVLSAGLLATLPTATLFIVMRKHIARGLVLSSAGQS